MNLNVNEVNSGIIKFLTELTFNPTTKYSKTFTVKYAHYRLIGHLRNTFWDYGWSYGSSKLTYYQITEINTRTDLNGLSLNFKGLPKRYGTRLIFDATVTWEHMIMAIYLNLFLTTEKHSGRHSSELDINSTFTFDHWSVGERAPINLFSLHYLK